MRHSATVRTVGCVVAIALMLFWVPVAPDTKAVGLAIINAPATVASGAAFQATFRVVNETQTLWPSGGAYKIGPQSPQDTQRWTTGRVLMPQDVGPGGTVDIQASFTAPSVDGCYAFDWKMLQEFVAWFGNEAQHAIAVGTASCAGVTPIGRAGGTDPGPGPGPGPGPTPQEPNIQVLQMPVAPPTTIVGQMILNTNAYSFSLGGPRWGYWTNPTGGQSFSLRQSGIWTGVDLNGVCDVHAEIRVAPAGWHHSSFATAQAQMDAYQALPFIDSFQFDHYTLTSTHHEKVTSFPDPGIVIAPGQQVVLMFVANGIGQGANFHAHHTVKIWGKWF